MRKHEKEVLNQLSKEQLIYLIEQLNRSQFFISETCVDESKLHISSEHAVKEIRKYIYHIPWSNDAEALKAYIDMKMEKISVLEYRRILGLED